MKKTGIFGGSFDPVHTAHLILAQLAAEAAKLDEVLFIPARVPPHKPDRTLACAHHRLEMLKLAVMDNPVFRSSDLELRRKAPSYTLTTIRQLEETEGQDTRLYLILGADSVRDIHNWHRAPELLEAVEIIGLKRPGIETGGFSGHEEAFGPRKAEELRNCFLSLPLIEISSSDIRKRLKEGRSIRYMAPEKVRQYIAENNRYRDIEAEG